MTVDDSQAEPIPDSERPDGLAVTPAPDDVKVPAPDNKPDPDAIEDPDSEVRP